MATKTDLLQIMILLQQVFAIITSKHHSNSTNQPVVLQKLDNTPTIQSHANLSNKKLPRILKTYHDPVNTLILIRLNNRLLHPLALRQRRVLRRPRRA